MSILNLFKKNYFVFGLLIFSCFQILSPKTSLIYLSYILLACFYYYFNHNIRSSLTYVLVLSFFSDISRASQYFMLEPQDLGLGSAYGISPFTLVILCMIPFIMQKKSRKVLLPDLAVFCFYLSTVVSSFAFPTANVFYTLITLTEVMISYFLLRQFVDTNNIIYLTKILVSMVSFQSVCGLFQFILRKPLGLIIESSIYTLPYGSTTSENTNIFRISGTFVHPNNFAAFLVAFLPIIILYPVKNWFLKSLKIIPILIIVFTFTRAAWLITVIELLVLFFINRNKLHLSQRIFFYKFLKYLIPIMIIFIVIFPYLTLRVDSFLYSFSKGESFDMRLMLMREGLNIIGMSPLFGVGLYQSAMYYTSYPVTNILEFIKIPFKIHNIFLEIGSESGIPAMLSFVVFLILVIRSGISKRQNFSWYRSGAIIGLIGFTCISMLNPFFHAIQFRLFFLLAAIILI